MRALLRLVLMVAVWFGLADWAYGQDDIFEFFAEEAEVVTASRQPLPINLAPATVYVVTSEDIQTSGGHTLWDALRSVPGVDVMTTRAFQGEVSLRGLNRPLNNRVLVLLDGKTLLNGFYDFVTWESIPVVMEAVDRIEVVLGPASALYGANAVNGVINIITKAGYQVDGSQMGLGLGEGSVIRGHALYGTVRDRIAWRVSVTGQKGNQFEDSDATSSEVFKGHGVWVYDIDDATTIEFSGGIAHHNTELATPGAAGAAFNDGYNTFLRFDAHRGSMRLRAFWNRGRSTLRGFDQLKEPNIDYDTYDLSLEQDVQLPFRNHLVVGGNFRRNTMRSKTFGATTISQNLWAGFFENVWTPHPHLNATMSGRLDHHPLTGSVLSPRGSLIYAPNKQHSLRLSAGTAFRYPTLTESYLNFTDRFVNDGGLVPNPPISSIEVRFSGNPDLSPERLRFAELAHTGNFGQLHTTLAGFHYRLKDIIVAGDQPRIEIDLPDVRVISTFDNKGEMRAWGGEASAELRLRSGLYVYANYALLKFSDEFEGVFVAVEGGPKHKMNAGFRFKRAGWLLNMSGHRVSSTSWDPSPLPESGMVRLDDYYLINGHLSYAFSGRWDGIRVGLDAFNMTDNRHAQLLPAQPNGDPGQSGEMLERRMVASVTYRF